VTDRTPKTLPVTAFPIRTLLLAIMLL
jgi:hypothetical protein